MLSARAASTAARRRGFMAGSGRPILAATVISRASLPNSLERIASCRPLRCMMFLNWEWPATAASEARAFSDEVDTGSSQKTRQHKNLEHDPIPKESDHARHFSAGVIGRAFCKIQNAQDLERDDAE